MEAFAPLKSSKLRAKEGKEIMGFDRHALIVCLICCAVTIFIQIILIIYCYYKNYKSKEQKK